MKSTEHFYAKILLFGEYGVIFGAEALSIPFTHFSGSLGFFKGENYTDLDFAQNSNENLRAFLDFLLSRYAHDPEWGEFDFKRFGLELDHGLFFESSIPQGYGVGSSGALVAAVYSRYARNQVRKSFRMSSTELRQLKGIFAGMESFFHGQSSGIDPLNSYLKTPLFFASDMDIRQVRIPRRHFDSGGAIFLVDSGEQGKTQTFVSQFFDLCKSAEYLERIRSSYIPLIQSCIGDLLGGRGASFFDHLETLSVFQFDQFRGMIPPRISALWRQGLNTGDFTLKLCGSGGGGFVLGFTRDFEMARKQVSHLGFELTPVYRHP